mgnify:CR=1 FL=1
MKKTIVRPVPYKKEDGSIGINMDIEELELTEEEINEEKQKKFDEESKFIYEHPITFSFTQEQLDQSEEDFTKTLDQMFEGSKQVLLIQRCFWKGEFDDKIK